MGISQMNSLKSRRLTEEDNPFELSHWPLFYRGSLGCIGTLKEWFIRTVAAALRKGDAKLTLDRVREHELAEARLAEMAIDIVAGEQQVELTGGSREQLYSLLQMENEAPVAPTKAVEAKPARTRRASTRPGTRKPKRDSVGGSAEASSPQTSLHIQSASPE
jgi:hypothetical protein